MQRTIHGNHGEGEKRIHGNGGMIFVGLKITTFFHFGGKEGEFQSARSDTHSLSRLPFAQKFRIPRAIAVGEEIAERDCAPRQRTSRNTSYPLPNLSPRLRFMPAYPAHPINYARLTTDECFSLPRSRFP